MARGETTMAKKTKKGFVGKIEKDTVKNDDFRRAYTGKYSQLVLMSLKPGEDGKRCDDVTSSSEKATW
jgi:hypothetical protein